MQLFICSTIQEYFKYPTTLYATKFVDYTNPTSEDKSRITLQQLRETIEKIDKEPFAVAVGN